MSCCHFNSHTQVNFVRSFVSNNFLKQLGFDSEAIQLEGVKYGTMLSGYLINNLDILKMVVINKQYFRLFGHLYYFIRICCYRTS